MSQRNLGRIIRIIRSGKRVKNILIGLRLCLFENLVEFNLIKFNLFDDVINSKL